MKWRQIGEAEVESTIADPDMQQDSIKQRFSRNAVLTVTSGIRSLQKTKTA
jgi:hypothetical protein